MKPIATLTDEELLRLAHDAATLRDAPEPVIQAAIALWPQAPGLGGLLKEGLRRLRAVLEVDSAVPAFAHGLRAMPSATRHLLFSVEGIDVDLRIVAAAGGQAISGQVLGPEEGGRVELRAPGDDTVRAAADLDALGEFRLAPVAVAACLITLHLPAGIVELPEIALDTPPGA